jgi:hypothetical protein
MAASCNFSLYGSKLKCLVSVIMSVTEFSFLNIYIYTNLDRQLLLVLLIMEFEFCYVPYLQQRTDASYNFSCRIECKDHFMRYT